MNLPPNTGVKLRHTDRQPKNRMGGLLDNINVNTQSESKYNCPTFSYNI